MLAAGERRGQSAHDNRAGRPSWTRRTLARCVWQLCGSECAEHSRRATDFLCLSCRSSAAAFLACERSGKANCAEVGEEIPTTARSRQGWCSRGASSASCTGPSRSSNSRRKRWPQQPGSSGATESSSARLKWTSLAKLSCFRWGAAACSRPIPCAWRCSSWCSELLASRCICRRYCNCRWGSYAKEERPKKRRRNSRWLWGRSSSRPRRRKRAWQELVTGNVSSFPPFEACVEIFNR
mmetsp:Transcript_89308/g.158429  ORF Transcript_89308/g.158429 Transcript_89308/m.158429 type:complete len:238 (+) Transcript_89308:69-782(+)